MIKKKLNPKDLRPWWRLTENVDMTQSEESKESSDPQVIQKTYKWKITILTPFSLDTKYKIIDILCSNNNASFLIESSNIEYYSDLSSALNINLVVSLHLNFCSKLSKFF